MPGVFTSRRVGGVRAVVAIAVACALAPSGAASKADRDSGELLAELIAAAAKVETPTRSAAEYEAAAKSYRKLLERLRRVEAGELDGDDEIDHGLLEAKLRTRLFEIEELELHKVAPVRYLALFSTSGLFTRPCGQGPSGVERAITELEKLPEILANGRRNLTAPARVWTENALYTAYYAQLLLRELLPNDACVDDPDLRARLLERGKTALVAVEEFEQFLRDELLPRSARSPAWKPEEIEFYQFVHERLDNYGVDEMLELARGEERALTAEMTALAARIHPSGDLETVWELMKQEAPPWPEVLPMAQRYVDMASEWLRGPGSHLISIPENFDYGARLTSPMARRILSFGGATYGPSVAGRISGYYVLTPLEDRLSEEEKASRIKAYNPYWTHVISYHEWLGHNVQRAHAMAHVERPLRRTYGSIYLSQAWSFYLEKLLEDEGYYEILPHLEALKTRMARLQMRMWRVQRILTKLSMARGEMTFEEAVDAYVEKIGMEPTNAFIEVQRDSQSPSPPGREIVGEKIILEMREAYRKRMGEHFELLHFHQALLRYGELPLPVIRRLMLGD